MTPPVQPVDAATVILVRPGTEPGAPWECFMVRRHVKSEFAADVYVFPGGKVDAADRDRELALSMRPARTLATSRPPSLEWLGLQVAAIREMFEEAGVLLAYGAEGEVVDLIGPEEARFADYRRRFQRGEVTMLEMARAEDLCLAADRLHHFSRWITPEVMPRRFDTHFFVAQLPAGQEPLHDDRETTASAWVSPRNALEQSRRGQFPLVFATEKHLERLARFETIEDVLEATKPADLEPVMPKIAEREGETSFLLPGEPGYDTA